MLRKDVKLGFAIGGVMLAVVVVYVLVVPNNDRSKTANLVTEDTQGTTTVNSGTKPDQTAVDSKTDEKSIAVAPDSGKPDNVGETPVAATPTTAPADATAKSGKGDIWDIALRDGVIPPSMSSTPTSNLPADKSDQPVDKTSVAVPDKVSDAQSTANKTDAMIVDKGATEAIDTPPEAKLAGDTQTPTKTAENTHIVKAGETLSSIAASVYGDSRSWKLISEANPNVNPNRLSAGTQLTIPAAKVASAATASNGNVTDSSTSYKVQPNDSLYRISMRLYGKADHVTKLYEDNKDVIGADPRHLKLGMVLKLTDKPEASVTSAAR